jgi:DNA-binding transcriptional MerR regulator
MDAQYRIGMVAKLSDLTTHTIRMWERRYGAVTPHRSEGGGRLYGDAEVERLRKLKRLVDAGHSIGRIATLADDELSELLQKHVGDPKAPAIDFDAEDAVRVFLEALSSLDLDKAEAVLKRVADKLPPRQLIRDVLLPLQHEIGRRWHVGTLEVAHEHAASQLLRTILGSFASAAAAQSGTRVCVATTPPGQRHDFGALMAGIIASLNGYRALYLGGDLPVEDIVRTVRESGAELLLLSISVDDPGSVAQLETIVGGLPDSVRIIAGGKGAPRGIRGVEMLNDLDELDAALAG